MTDTQPSTQATAVQPQFYKKVVALSEKGHADWRLKAERDYTYTAKTNSVLLTSIEFMLAASDFPIVFIAQGNQYSPVAVLGLKPDQNLFVSDNGEWQGEYIPAYIRRYPFILAGDNKAADDKTMFTVCIDESYTGFNRKQGEPLFEDGQQTAYLKKAVDFLKDFQAQGRATEKFCRTLSKHNLLEPMQANVAAENGERFSVAGFHVVSIERLKASKPLVLAELVKSDEMGLIYQHLFSLGNFSRLIERYSSQNLAKAG